MHIERCLRKGDQRVRFVITDHGHGWAVREDEGMNAVSDVVYDDWHRAERDLKLFELRAAMLRQQGWVDTVPADVVTAE